MAKNIIKTIVGEFEVLRNVVDFDNKPITQAVKTTNEDNVYTFKREATDEEIINYINKVAKSEEYGSIYDNIQFVTNDITNFCGMTKMEDVSLSARTMELMDKLSQIATELSNTAHELGENLAWD